MMAVLRYGVPITGVTKDKFCVNMSRDAEILSVAFWKNEISIWAKVIFDPVEGLPPLKERWFTIVGTGYDFEVDVVGYVGSILFDKIAEVYHVFEISQYPSVGSVCKGCPDEEGLCHWKSQVAAHNDEQPCSLRRASYE